MDSKLELTKSQLETILRLINDANLDSQGSQSTDRQVIKLDDNRKLGQSIKKRSYSALHLNNAKSTDELINESFRKSISNLLENSRRPEKFPEIKPETSVQQPKLKRNKSLIELRKERWDRERNELKESDSWYEKFDSFKKRSIDRSRSQPDILLNYHIPHKRFENVSRLCSPDSHFDDESIALSNAPSPASQTNRYTTEPSRSSDQFDVAGEVNEFINQPRRSFRRYVHKFDNVNLLEKRRKQQEYKSQLEAQLNYKREQSSRRRVQQRMEDRILDEKLITEQAELRKEFENDRLKGETVKDDRLMKDRKLVRRPPNDLERLEMKSKELIKVFKEASTQTDGGEGMISSKEASIAIQTAEPNKWQSAVLQPVRTNRSALLRTISKSSSKPKWTKQSKDEDSTSTLPRLNEKGYQLQARKKWNS